MNSKLNSEISRSITTIENGLAVSLIAPTIITLLTTKPSINCT